jgi:hypothetical protein
VAATRFSPSFRSRATAIFMEVSSTRRRAGS